MRSLLDINVIIALIDPDHAFHERAHGWWETYGRDGWSSCPITENGVIRILSNPGYSAKVQFSPGELIADLQKFVGQTDHEFWEDSLSLRDEKIFAVNRIHGSRQLTDLYLLALAVANEGRLVTFDEKIPLSVVHGATVGHLWIV